jgi:hypothetical protein
MRLTPAPVALALAFGSVASLSLAYPPSAHAQTPPANAPAIVDPALAAQKAAFLALPEAARKAAQDALVWLGFYNGVNDGEFGKRTRDAILAFEASVKAPAEGALSAAELEALFAAAQKARDAAGFKAVSDPKTGARIGSPVKLITARSRMRLDFASSADADLGALYARLSIAPPGGKIVYKAIKPDAFFVVSGQDGATTFYTRFDKNAAANPPVRGFTFAYPAAQAGQLNRIALAVANSFEPFPETPAATAESVPAPAAAPEPAATALVIAPGKALTALKAGDCPNPTVAGKPVRIERADAATGLTLLAGDFAAGPQTPRFGAPAPDLVVLGFAGDRIAANSASFSGGEALPAVIAAVDRSGGGGPVFDRRGALVGLVAPIPGEPRRIAGVALASPNPLIAPEAVRAFLGGGESASDKAAPLSAGDIAAREKGALVAVFCPK